MTPFSWPRLVRISVADADATDSSTDDDAEIHRRQPNKPKKFVRKAIFGFSDFEAGNKYKGVRPRPSGKWQADITVGARRYHLGSFPTAHEAAVAYDLASLRLRRPNAFTNFHLGSEETIGGGTNLEKDHLLEPLARRPRECSHLSASPEARKEVAASFEWTRAGPDCFQNCLLRSNAVSGAPECTKEVGASVEQDRIGPDYFSYYAFAVADLLSQRENILPCCNTSKLYQGKVNWFTEKTIDDSCGGSGFLGDNNMGAWLSDFRKERLKLLLRESVRDLAMEVDEILNPVIAMHQLRCRLRSKVSSSSSITAGSCTMVNDDLQFLLENDSILVEEAVDKYSNELSTTLEHMEERLNKVLDSVMSTCRQMTHSEKHHLLKLIQKLPEENLVRVAEIIQRNLAAEKQGCDEIYVDLEQQDNITLWRLYYYVEAVGKAKMLAAEYCPNFIR